VAASRAISIKGDGRIVGRRVAHEVDDAEDAAQVHHDRGLDEGHRQARTRRCTRVSGSHAAATLLQADESLSREPPARGSV